MEGLPVKQPFQVRGWLMGAEHRTAPIAKPDLHFEALRCVDTQVSRHRVMPALQNDDEPK